eukprot:330052-Prorocentrum_minimum.AAC.5
MEQGGLDAAGFMSILAMKLKSRPLGREMLPRDRFLNGGTVRYDFSGAQALVTGVLGGMGGDAGEGMGGHGYNNPEQTRRMRKIKCRSNSVQYLQVATRILTNALPFASFEVSTLYGGHAQAASAEKAALAVANKLNMQALPIRQYLVRRYTTFKRVFDLFGRL